jgi:hypothetical protein
MNLERSVRTSGCVTALAAALVLFVSGCEPEKSDDIIPDATEDMALAIVDPANSAVVHSRYPYVVKGVGIRDNYTGLSLSVHTDKWYEQGGPFERSSNGSWLANVSLGGTHQYNKHTIRIVVTYPDHTESAEVRGVVARD